VLYTYVLLCGRDHRFYTGCTRDLRLRFQQQQSGRVPWTASRQPVRLIYYEASRRADDAYRRERFLKSGKGKSYLKSRLAGFLGTLSQNKLERH
jgi:putative endonuclease